MEMKPMRPWMYFFSIFNCLMLLASSAAGEVVKAGDRTYLVDRTGERWDISQAVSIGYDPHKFEFGIGRHAFQPLDDGDWSPKIDVSSPGMRIIGVAVNGHAHAYSVERLRSHETANTLLGTRAIVTGY